MFARIARKVLEALASPESTTDDRPSNRVRLAFDRLEDRCTPAMFTVNTPDDIPDANPGDGEAGVIVIENRTKFLLTSLRSAIEEGNTLAAMGKDSDHTINFDTKKIGGNTISVSKGAYETLKANFTINGGGVTVERPVGAAQYRIFDVEAKREVSINELGITGGDTPGSGGGIRSDGELSLDSCFIYSNTAAVRGGGVAAENGKLTISYSSLWLNQGKFGGGIYTATSVSDFAIVSSAVFSNSASSVGGGIMFASAANSIHDTQIYGNTSVDFAGGFYALRSFIFSGGEVRGNIAGGCGGGAYILTAAAAVSTWTGCKVDNNEAGQKGGGFYVSGGKLEFTDPASFTGNKAAQGFDGGAYSPPLGDVTSKGLPVGSQKIWADQ